MDIYAIGHSNYLFEKFVKMLKKYNIDCVVDIRGTPYSKYNTQYNKEVFETNLKKQGFIYIYMGLEFGVIRKNKVSYINEGYADFEKVVKEDIFLDGINRLKKGCNMGYKIALVGAMQEPIRCHRGMLLGRELNKVGFDVKYIMHDESLKTQSYIEEQLLDKYFDERNQLSIDNLLGNDLNREAMIEESYRLANKEIGCRSENLKE